MDIPIIHYGLIHYKYLSEGLADTKKDIIEDILKYSKENDWTM